MSGREKEQSGNEREDGEKKNHRDPWERKKRPSFRAIDSFLKRKENNRMMKDRVVGWEEEGRIRRREEQKAAESSGNTRQSDWQVRCLCMCLCVWETAAYIDVIAAWAGAAGWHVHWVSAQKDNWQSCHYDKHTRAPRTVHVHVHTDVQFPPFRSLSVSVTH